MSTEYQKQEDEKALEKMRAVILRLPEYCKAFFNAKNHVLSAKTRLGYAQDLEIFFYFLKTNNPLYKDIAIRDIPFSCLENLKPFDIEEFLSFVESYDYNGKHYSNGYSGKKRKLASIRELFHYYCKISYLKSNPASLVDTPKESKKKNIRHLDNEEKTSLLAQISSEENLTPKQLEMKRLLELRDIAITTLFLGTGLRVSELVGLNLDDVNLQLQFIHVLGKGDKYRQVYFNEEVYNALDMYLTYCRPLLKPDKDEQAFFISRRKTRISVRSVEYLTEKISKRGLGGNNAIHPHNLRSTFGTDLYRVTGDISLVKDILGHEDISTTKKYYADQNVENLKRNKSFKIF